MIKICRRCGVPAREELCHRCSRRFKRCSVCGAVDVDVAASGSVCVDCVAAADGRCNQCGALLAKGSATLLRGPRVHSGILRLCPSCAVEKQPLRATDELLLGTAPKWPGGASLAEMQKWIEKLHGLSRIGLTLPDLMHRSPLAFSTAQQAALHKLFARPSGGGLVFRRPTTLILFAWPGNPDSRLRWYVWLGGQGNAGMTGDWDGHPLLAALLALCTPTQRGRSQARTVEVVAKKIDKATGLPYGYLLKGDEYVDNLPHLDADGLLRTHGGIPWSSLPKPNSVVDVIWISDHVLREIAKYQINQQKGANE